MEINEITEIEFNDLKKKLTASPLYPLTLCSKELAHSNMWAWLIEKDKRFLTVFFKDADTDNEEYTVRREEEHRDLTVWVGDNIRKSTKCYVIENKLKSIPTREQLERYTEKLEEKRKKKKLEFECVLTGIEDTLEDKGDWKFVSYKTIVDKIRALMKESYKSHNLTQFDVCVVEQYCSDVENIISILSSDLGNNKKYGNGKYVTSCDELKDNNIRLYDIYLKLRACDFAKEIKDMISKENSDLEITAGPNNWRSLPVVDVDFNNASATITIIYRQITDEKEVGRIGVQLQGNEFRIYAGPNNIAKNIKRDEVVTIVYNELENYGWFEAYESKKSKKIRKKATKMKKKVCSYVGNYAHLYQYYLIEDGQKTEDLKNDILNLLKEAKDLIEKKRLDFAEIS